MTVAGSAAGLRPRPVSTSWARDRTSSASAAGVTPRSLGRPRARSASQSGRHLPGRREVSAAGRAQPVRYALPWYAPVAQGIEHRPPEAGAQVRILPGAPLTEQQEWPLTCDNRSAAILVVSGGIRRSTAVGGYPRPIRAQVHGSGWAVPQRLLHPASRHLVVAVDQGLFRQAPAPHSRLLAAVAKLTRLARPAPHVLHRRRTQR